MPADEIGCYIVVLDLIYQHGGPIPYYPRNIGGIIDASTRKTNNLVQALLKRGKLSLIDGRLSNPVAAEVIEKREAELIIAAINGAKGGRTRVENERRVKQMLVSGQGSLKAGLTNLREERVVLTTSNEYVAEAEVGQREEEPAPSPTDGVSPPTPANGHDAAESALAPSPALLNSRLMRKARHA
jgi:hypothetical protein